ncbi:zinc finger protein 135-like [Drosophila novamexicana]|uniref:zinc finger protein 135-like n=1 Tax=Drosophila novamexicana TaxID=47314 RepID=UPI0011E59144|nr:zinc finger protein 135-like [Drosophila novamexicana]
MEGLMNPACIKQEPVQHEEHEAVLADMACGAIEIGPIKIELPETECHKNNMKVQRNKQSPVKNAQIELRRVYPCAQCARTFDSAYELRIHRQIHTGKLPYKCSYCPISFAHKSIYTAHIRGHSNGGPYVKEPQHACHHCGKTFANKPNYAAHMDIHSSLRPYRCTYCPKGFLRSCALKKHLRTHTGERPYKCNHCSKAFIQSAHLKSHIRTHADDRAFMCEQ